MNTLAHLKKACFKKNWDDLPLYPRLVTFKISIRIIRLLEGTRITPNAITMFSLIVGFVAIFLFSKANEYMFFAGALMLEFYYILDCVDGQLARVKKLCSKEGAFLDYLLNYIVHPMVFVSIGFGCYSASHNVIYLILGMIAAWMTVLGYCLSDCKQSLLYMHLLKEKDERVFLLSLGQEKCKKCAREKSTLSKRIFMVMHKCTTYPTIMNIITVASIIMIVVKSTSVVYLIMVFFAVNSVIVFILRLQKIVTDKKITEQYEQGRKIFFNKENLDE